MLGESVRIYAQRIRKWWEQLLFPPTPSSVFVEFTMQKAIVLLPALRLDEQDYSDNIEVIASRELTYFFEGMEPIVLSIPLTQPSLEIHSIPDDTDVTIELSSVTVSGRASDPNVRVVHSTPSQLPPVPVPDAVTVTFVTDDITDTGSTT